MSVNSIIVFVSPVAILCAAGIAWFANYHVQHRIHRHIRLIRSVDDLKGRLRDFVDLSADYWTLDSPRSEKHRTLEAHLIARKRLILEELIELKYRSPRWSESFRQAEVFQKDLWQTATGGCFQQAAWQPDPKRVALVAGKVSIIISCLDRAH